MMYLVFSMGFLVEAMLPEDEQIVELMAKEISVGPNLGMGNYSLGSKLIGTPISGV